MKFKVGDRVKYIGVDSIGVILRISPTSKCPYYVRFQTLDDVCDESELELVAAATGGPAIPLVFPDTIPTQDGYISTHDLYDAITADLSEREPAKALSCDCGGFKTYNTMAPEVHSSWCSSRK